MTIQHELKTLLILVLRQSMAKLQTLVTFAKLPAAEHVAVTGQAGASYYYLGPIPALKNKS